MNAGSYFEEGLGIEIDKNIIEMINSGVSYEQI